MGIDEIARHISELVDKNVAQLKNNDQKWKNQYETVMDELEGELRLTEESLKDFKEENLTVSFIEAEGYLRCLKAMVSRFRNFEMYT